MSIRTTQKISSRKRVLTALGLGLAAAAAMAIPALLVARDETATHAQLHVASSAVVMTVAAALALVWRSPRHRSEWLARRSLIATLSLLALAQLTESGGAYAWGPDGETLTSPVLHVVHTASALTGAAALFAVGASAVSSLATLALRLGPLVRAGTTMLLLVVSLAVAAGAAEASSIVYVKASSIWVVRPDGTHASRLTRGSLRFASPSQADDGTIVALGADNHLYRFTHRGRPLGGPVATWLGLGGGQGFSGPYRVRVSPDGSKVAFTVLHVEGVDQVSGNSEIEGITSYSYADRYTSPGILGLVKGWDNPAWIDNRHTIAFNPGADTFPGGVNVAYHELGHADPNAADDLHHAYTWFDDAAAPTMIFGDITRRGDKLAVGEDGFAATRTIRLYSVAARPPYRDDAPVYRCRLASPPGAGYESVSWSPDGQSLAYEAGGNIYTVHVGPIASGCGNLGAPRLLVRGGTSPSWGPR
jgi:hypothetical protein